MKPYLPLEQCKHGYLYKISSRNLSYGVYNEKMKGFIGVREKFGSRYLFTEYHWDTGAPCGTVCPKEELEKCPFADEDVNEDNEALFNWLEKFSPCSECGGSGSVETELYEGLVNCSVCRPEPLSDD